MGKPKFRPSPLHGTGSYLVFMDGVDHALGVVIKKVEHYNLIRPITVTSWIVRPAVGSGQVFEIPLDKKFSTRRDATDALVRGYRRSLKWEKVPPIPGGNTDVWQCTSDLCGALCRADGRDRHDDAFHAYEVGSMSPEGQAGYQAYMRGEKQPSGTTSRFNDGWWAAKDAGEKFGEYDSFLSAPDPLPREA